jgi:O-antigen/teichoic acid export membrane protein
MRQAVVIFGITLALRWPVALYTGVLFGLERQVLFNILSGGIATLRVLGGIVAVVLLPNILVFLAWQLVSAVAELLLMRTVTWSTVSGGSRGARGVFDLGVFKKIWAFSASITTNSIVGSILKQTDKFLLSGMVSLNSLGYYSVAYSAYTGLTMIPSPVADASFPRFAALIAQERREDLARMYHKASQYVSFLVAPAAAVVAFFSAPILRLWTQSEDVTSHAASILTLLTIAFGLNAMMQIPLRMQLAHGIVWIALGFNSISAVVLVPVMYLLISRYGLQGAGIGILLFNLFYYLIVPHIMHRQILPAEKWRWILGDTLSFLVLGAFFYGAAYWLSQGSQKLGVLALLVSSASLLYALGCLAMHPLLRAGICDLLLHNRIVERFRQVPSTEP